MCTRIWCVLPVARLHSSKLASAKRLATLYRVKAGLPPLTTAMRIRLRGSRPTGAAISPSDPTTPCTTEIFALYRSGLQLPNQIGLRLQSLRHDEQPARALVEPMHDAGPGNRRELR